MAQSCPRIKNILLTTKINSNGGKGSLRRWTLCHHILTELPPLSKLHLPQSLPPKSQEFPILGNKGIAYQKQI